MDRQLHCIANLPDASGHQLGAAYGTYTLMAILSFVFVLARAKETRGLELEAMQ
jgi:hypothetical protein